MFWKKSLPTRYQLNVDGIIFEVTRKRIKNLYIRVNRRDGTVKVSCPAHSSEEQLYRFIQSKLNWVKRHRTRAQGRPSRAEYSFTTGEYHWFCGIQYELRVIASGRTSVSLNENSIELRVRKGSSAEKRRKVIENWYRQYLKDKVPELIANYEQPMGVKVKEFGVKKMKTRWGTCNITDRRIWLNLALAKKSAGCLEMVVVHEMVHLLERLHSKRFYRLMDEFMPDWHEYEQELNSTVD